MVKTTLSAPAEDCLLRVHRMVERAEPVTTSSLAKQLGVRDSTVTVMVQKLAGKKLLIHRPRKEISLTKSGTEIAQGLIRRHRLIETYLCAHLDYSWDEVHAEAERIEHAVSEKFVDAIDKKLGHPSFDPHGDPIPDRNGNKTERALRNLSECASGTVGTLARVISGKPEVLIYLSGLGMNLGAQLEVIDAPKHDTVIRIRIAKKEFALGRELASKIMIETTIP